MGMIQDFQKADKERRVEVATMLKEFAQADAERRTDTANLIREFTALAPERQAEVATMVKEFAQADAERRTEVWGKAPARSLEFGAVVREAAEIWQKRTAHPTRERSRPEEPGERQAKGAKKKGNQG